MSANEEAPAFDYIVVGGGSAGCVATNRLVDREGARVLLLEAGWPDDNPMIRMPAGFIKFLGGSKFLTEHLAVPQEALGGRRPAIWQGNVLGGGSSVNAMVYMRGRPADYDHWDAVTGGAGWSWADMLPYFLRQEANQRFNNPMHGIDGPLKVSDPVHVAEMSYIYLKTMQAQGVKLVDDFNAGDQRGVGFMQTTTYPRVRCSAVRAFLDPVRGSRNLEVKTRARATRVLFAGRRASGVEYRVDGVTHTAQATRAVILTAGAFVTPQLLMLSGIGPAAQLREHGLEVLVDAPGVGANLHDHHEVPLIASTDRNYGYFKEDRGWRMLANGLNYLLFKGGPVASGGVDACAFVNPQEPAGEPTIKLYCVPLVYGDKEVLNREPMPGVTFTSCVLQPKARGSVRLRSADPLDLPLVDPNYLGHPDDMRLQVDALLHARTVMRTRPMADTIVEELLPGAAVVDREGLEEHCRRTVKTNWHPCGTARMGRAGDPMAVLTPDLAVKGVEALHVLDASLMPTVPHGNTNAPTMAAADRAVDKLLGRSQPS
ncbi:MAG: GMC family oxidoreductase N-terminal domain-containing protein [Geminicoccaceae bacterium]